MENLRGLKKRIVDKKKYLYHNETMKKTVYLDTTIPSYLFDNREEIGLLIHITKKCWNEERRKKMYINEILKEKYRVQAEIAKTNGHDIKKIAEEASKTVLELSKKFNIKPDYFDDIDIARTVQEG